MNATHEIVQETWSEYFDWLSKELLGSPVSIEIVRPSAPPLVEATKLALQTLAYDQREDVFEVSAASGGSRLPGTVRHFVDSPERVVVDREGLLAPITIEVAADDGVRTVITIEREPEFTG